MNQYEREKYDDVVNKRLLGIKIYCMSIEFYAWKRIEFQVQGPKGVI